MENKKYIYITNNQITFLTGGLMEKLYTTIWKYKNISPLTYSVELEEQDDVIEVVNASCSSLGVWAGVSFSLLDCGFRP